MSDATITTLTEAEIEELRAFGEESREPAGQVLFAAGDAAYDFLVVLDGEVHVVRPDDDGGETLIAAHGAGRFIGELNLLTGQRAWLTARTSQPSRILTIRHDDFRRLMSSRPTLADTIFSTLVARRQRLQQGDGARAIRIVGSRYSPPALALHSFAARNKLAYSWLDADEDEGVDALLESMDVGLADLPVVITSTKVLRHPTPAEFAEYLGLTFHAPPGFMWDLVVVGTGPAGLAASVYGASEGLKTVSVDAVAFGGQAGSSSRIENYVGFPNGVSGENLTAGAAIQAMRLGAQLNAPCKATGLRTEDAHGFHVVELSDGSEVPCKAVVVASGARYRRLAVADLERFEGAGVYYAATALEATACKGSAVVVVGGGNSAGQAAIFLAQHGSHVSIAIRRRDLVETMSRYLIERIEADPGIDLLTQTEVRALAGGTHLEAVTVEETSTGQRRTIAASGLFCFIGADPATGWLKGEIALDDNGFILTDRSLPDDVVAGPAFAARPPLPFETSVQGVFAAGDVRHGSLKRVAAAVGEGSSAVRSVHDHLAAHG